MNTDENQPIIDSLLDEWLGKCRPRSLSAKDLSNRPIDPKRVAEFDQALQAAADIRSRLAITSVFNPRRRKSNSPVFKIACALAACSLFGLGVWAFSNRDHWVTFKFGFPDFVANSNKTTSEPDKKLETSIVQAPELKSQASNDDITHSAPSKPSHESLSLDSLPFNAEDSTNSKAKKLSNRKAQIAKRSETELIAMIDQQMQLLWKNHDASPAAPIEGIAWIDRVTRQLLSRPATAGEKEGIASKDNPAFRLASLHRIVDSSEFSQSWAKRLGGHYLGVGPLSARDLSDDSRAFVQWIRKELNQSHRLDLIVKNIVLVNELEPENSGPTPSMYWWAKAGSIAKTTPAELLSSKFLGARASCSRCHDGNSVAKTDQSQFWGIAAITNGVEVSNPFDTAKPSVRYRSVADPLFYERKDASLVAVDPTLPNGKKLQAQEGSPSQIKSTSKQNLVALSNWMLESDELAQSHTNFVWKTLLGQPLLSDYPLDKTEGAVELEELSNVLSQQLRAHNYDLRQLVVWIAASQVFSLESVRPDGNWYLTASEKELKAFQQRQRFLATFPTPYDPSLRSLDKLAQWFPSISDRGRALANPLPVVLPKGAMNNTASGNLSLKEKSKAPSEVQVQYLIATQSLPMALAEEVDRMIKSNLAWNVLVDHAFYMTGTMPPTISDRESANQILEVSRDKRLALVRIIAARL